MTVEGMFISNKSPYFQPGNWHFPLEIDASIGAFGVSLFEFSSFTNNLGDVPESGLNANISLTFDGALAIEATGNFDLVGELDLEGSYHEWKIQRLDLNSIQIDAEFGGGNKIKGSVAFYRPNNGLGSANPAYGSGFRGTLTTEFKGLPCNIDALAQFGTVGEGEDKYKYFMIDALVTLTNGIPVFAGIELKGFGGGIYRNMTRPPGHTAFAQLEAGDTEAFGAALSGIVYTPTSTPTLGFHATVVIATPTAPTGGTAASKTAFNASLTFYMQFANTDNSDGWSVQKLGFQGVGSFMAPISFGASPDTTSIASFNAAVKATVLFELDLTANYFLGMLSVDVEAKLLTGRIWAEIFIDSPDDAATPEEAQAGTLWHLFIGTQTDPNFLALNLAFIKAKLTCYFMIGNEGIPSTLPPPFNESNGNSVNVDGYNTNRGDTGALASGSGVAFGASFVIGVDVNFLFLYANLEGGMGFDISLTRLLAECYTDAEVGVDGWYARGQAWAYIQAEIGARIKLGPFKKNIKAFSGRASALLQAELPNPFYARGELAASLNLLGLISFDAKFEATFGEKLEDAVPNCQTNLDELVKEIEFIDHIRNSEDMDEEVPCNADVIVKLFIPDNEVLTFYNDDGDPEYYRIRLVSVTVLDDNGHALQDDQGGSLPFYGEWNLANTEKTYRYPNLLPEYTAINVKAKASYYKLRYGDPFGDSGVWDRLNDPDNPGEDVTEIKEYRFETTHKPYEMNASKIRRSYPIVDQLHYHKDQYDEYRLEFLYDVSYLINEIPEGYIAKGQITDSNNQQVGPYMDVTAHSLNQGNVETSRSQVVVTKNESLSNDTPYNFEIVYLHDSGEVLPELGEKHNILTYPFTTSKYATFEDKLATFQQASSSYDDGGNYYSENDIMTTLMNVGETFDAVESIETERAYLPLVDFKMKVIRMEGEEEVTPAWFEYMPHITATLIDRGCSTYGLDDPLKAISLGDQNEDTNLELHVATPKEMYKFAETVIARAEFADYHTNCCSPNVDCSDWSPPGGGGGVEQAPAEIEESGGGPNGMDLFFVEFDRQASTITGPTNDGGSWSGCVPKNMELICDHLDDFPFDIFPEDDLELEVNYRSPFGYSIYKGSITIRRD